MQQHLIVDGVIAAQLPNAGEVFGMVIKSFDTIIEIGYHRGGFSRWLNQNKSSKTRLVCYDITAYNQEVFDEGIEFKVADCFSNEVVEEIRGIINSSKKVLLLCDGGAKNQEFNLYAPMIKKGDVIMLHDYHDETLPESYDSFTGPIWGSHAESGFNAIKDTVESTGLEKYNYDSFRSVIWGSFIKS
jgi:hypothetical protein